jgi:methylenetetrahydrofolate--tRNA-(uracil-5-)-methyltransferase
MGALARYVALTETKNFQPVNITFALLPALPELEQRRVRKKRDRRELQIRLALQEWDVWLQDNFSRTAVAETAT